MAIITFWSNTTKQTGQTMSLVSIATSMAIEHNYRTLIISTKYNDDTLELCFGSTEKNKSLINKLMVAPTAIVDNGIEGLSKIVNSGRLKPDIIQSYTHVVFKNRLEVLYGYRKNEDRPSNEEYAKLQEKYKEIIQNANQFYDIVFVDLNNGTNDEMTKEILNISDVIVCNVQQKLSIINEFLEFKDKFSEGKKNNLILNIGRFDNYSKYSVKNISRYVGIKKDITVIPYNTLFNEAADEQNVADLFLRIRKVSESDRNYTFIKCVQEAVDKIIYKMQEVQMNI